MVMEKIDELFRYITKLALLNVMWLGLTIAGLGVLGFFPATVAMFTVARRWVREGQQGKVVKPFWVTYKAEFLRANLYGWIFAAAGAVLYVNFHIIQASNGSVPYYVVIAYMLLVVMYLLVLATILPISVHFEGGMGKILKHTFQFILGKIHLSVLFGVLIWAGIYLSLSFPAVILFFSGSLMAYLLMWFFNRTIEKLEYKQLQQNELTLKG
ncbi:YesL family protein [Alkalicoccus daliensis]|uniref:Uncharacterized membrane protein YesL n=1 Tax=Alkalicoccus daliensis TaxID=745820 RepID=A0A1H0FW44_9BACI|nr:DUF624 domain-containing protein [Alkalicoccus daliensis]SDN98791.1 Uncharacterized membrane protein YesL [Alkalicoccus daliensis]